jgi:hypothetical protein
MIFSDNNNRDNTNLIANIGYYLWLVDAVNALRESPTEWVKLLY